MTPVARSFCPKPRFGDCQEGHFLKIKKPLRAWHRSLGAFVPNQGFGILRKAIVWKLKGPCGHDSARSELLSPIRVSGFSGSCFFENYFAPAGMTMVVQDFCASQQWLVVINHYFQLSVIFPKVAAASFDFWKTYREVRLWKLFGHNYFLNSAIRIFRRSNHTNSARRSSLEGWWG